MSNLNESASEAFASAVRIQDSKFKDLGLTKTIVNAEHVCTYSRALSSVSDDNPVLVLLHGYPQSSYLYVFEAFYLCLLLNYSQDGETYVLVLQKPLVTHLTRSIVYTAHAP
jgi:pimeloyl-ACP methyl ester carboxylesterase